jgi:LPXTG-site transpeptidase (sortase) family protein
MNLTKNLSSKIILPVVFVGFVISTFSFFYFIPQKPNPPTENIITLPKQEYGLPVRLRIPAINVDAAVKSLGLTPQGNMDIPNGPDDVAWYNLGNRPGENGSAVIAGHYGTWKNGKGSVFDNLHKLIKGDKLYIEDEKGVTITFVVRESRSFEPNADAEEVFGSDDEKLHLNLITCEGIWNKDSKSYSKRLVVFTDKE